MNAQGDQLDAGPAGVRESRRLAWNGWTIKAVSVLAVLMVSGIGVVVAITLFTQTFPTFTPGQIVSSSCANQNLVVQDQGGSWVRFDCPSGPAFTASAGTATATPTGSAGYTDLYIVQGTPTTSCTAGTTASQQLTGSTPVTFGSPGTPTGAWNYCADFSDFVPKPTFTVAWTQ